MSNLSSLKKVLLLLFLPISFYSQSQAFWTETFSSACGSGCALPYTGVNGTWTWVSTGANGAAANTWFVSLAEAGLPRGECGAAGSGTDASLHVGNVSNSPAAGEYCPTGDCGAAADYSPCCPDVTANAQATSPVIDCSGKSSITLSFNYMMRGLTAVDYATVDYYDGVTWSLLASPPQTALTCAPQGLWTNYSIALPASANNNPNVQIGFNWQNTAGNSGKDPSFAVDSIQLSATVTLPITLISFTAAYTGTTHSVLINWAVASQLNNKYFVVEKTLDGINFQEVDTLPGAGTYPFTKYYSAIDNNPTQGISYYRLKQIDMDGHTTEFAPVAVFIGNTPSNSLHLYPNPIGSGLNSATLVYNSTNQNRLTINISDMTGRIINSFTLNNIKNGENIFPINTSELVPGMYILQAISNQELYTLKFIKQ